jgi:hypothetical protein
MERRHILRFLFVRGLTTVFVVGGLGVEDQQNGFLEVLILLHVIFFLVGLGQRGSLLLKTKNP